VKNPKIYAGVAETLTKLIKIQYFLHAKKSKIPQNFQKILEP
jgi:hypothetical protein